MWLKPQCTPAAVKLTSTAQLIDARTQLTADEVRPKQNSKFFGRLYCVNLTARASGVNR